MPTVSIYTSDTLNSVINNTAFCLLSLVVVGTTLAMTLAFLKFIRIVQRTQTNSDFNRCYIVVQIIGLLFWFIAWVAGGIFLLTHGADFHDFSLTKNILIIDTLGFMATMLNFLIIAYVIYKTSVIAAAGKHQQSEQSTLLSFLRGQYSAAKRKASIEAGQMTSSARLSLSPPYSNAARLEQ